MLLPIGHPIEQASGIAEDERVIMVSLILIEIGHGRDVIAVERPAPIVGIIIVIMPDHLERIDIEICRQEHHERREKQGEVSNESSHRL